MEVLRKSAGGPGNHLISLLFRENFQFCINTDANGQLTFTSRQGLIFFFSIYEALNFVFRGTHEKAKL